MIVTSMKPSKLTKAERAAKSGKRIPTCPHCGEELTRAQVASLMGSLTSERKSKASAENGKLGGRPKKQQQDK